MPLTPLPPTTWDGSPHTATTSDAAEIVGHLLSIFNSFVEETGTLHGKMAANGNDPHSHFAYRMVEWGECKQLDQALFGTYDSNGVKTVYGIYDIIMAYSTATNACTLTFDISNADASSVAIPAQAKVKGAKVTLPPSTGLVPSAGDTLGGWFIRAADYYGSDTGKRDVLVPFGGEFVVPNKNNLTVRLNASATLSKIQFNLNGGQGDPPDPVVVRTGDMFTAPGATGITAPAGKYFVGWASTNDAAVFEIAPNAEVQYTGLYTTLYAVYYTMSV